MSNYLLLLEIMERKPDDDPWIEEAGRLIDQSTENLKREFKKRLYKNPDAENE